LRAIINTVIKILEKIIGKCDAYGVWGSRTKGGLLYSTRNLDWNTNTGIDMYKLVTVYTIDDSKYGPLPGNTYATLGFASGLGALAGMNSMGISVSEMNLDNSQVTFTGLAFPLRLRYVLEQSTNLKQAVQTWTDTNNTNSFNFLIGSATDAKSGPDGAYALETIMGYTAFYGADNSVEKSAIYHCDKDECKGWTNQTGDIHIGQPITEAVFRTNHAFDPTIMKTQEPLFNDTVFRYDLMHDLFVSLEQDKQQIDINTAVGIAATLGTKGVNFLSCDPSNFRRGENIMSVTYAPGPRPESHGSKNGYLYVAWEQGGKNWRPAACNPYVLIDMDQVITK